MKRKIFILEMVIIMVVLSLRQTICKDETVIMTNLKITNIKDTIPKVALTFDDGPSSQFTEKLLDGLRERGVRATFFVMGESANKNTDIIKRMYNEGHLIGNHTYTHVDLNRISRDKAQQEIKDTNECIENITGQIPSYIRPPYGDVSKEIMDDTDMNVVLWTIDPEDWKDQNAYLVSERVISKVKSGDIILLHDIFKSSVDAALIIVDELKERGYQFVTVDKINNSRIYPCKNSEEK